MPWACRSGGRGAPGCRRAAWAAAAGASALWRVPPGPRATPCAAAARAPRATRPAAGPTPRASGRQRGGAPRRPRGRRRPAARPAPAPPPGGCLCKFGVIGDIQYADCDDGADFSGYQKRYFRNALQLTRRAVARWVSEDAVDFAVQLGDAIDGRNKEAGQTDQALAEVLASFPEDLPRCDLLGNHELYNFPRARLKRSGLRLRGEGLPGAEPGGDSGCYFAFPADGPAGRWEVVCLDAYDIASIGYAADDPRRAHAEMVLACLNPRTTIPGVDWFEGLPSERHRFVPYNGGLGDDQLDWLRQRLAACAEAGRKVILLSHIPILEASTTPKTVLWNADQVLELLRSWEGRSVVAVLAGHDHDGGYAVDPESGVHHVTFLSPMICKPGSGRSGAATVRCFEDHAELVGHGVFCVESGTSSRGRAYTHIELRRLDPRGWL